MNQTEVLRELEACGTEQNCKIYRRHGSGESLYGVSFANLGKLKKKIKVDHELAQQLWATGNHDARVLATMIADPAQANDKLLEAWAKDVSNYVITDLFSGLVSQTPLARQEMEKWMKSKNEWIRQAGWNLLGRLAMNDQELPDEFFENYLGVIEREIHASQNRVKHAMNGAVIAIGIRNGRLEKKALAALNESLPVDRTMIHNGRLEKKALAAAKRIGKVEVDHGETDCQTPDAADYIRKAGVRKRR